MLSKSLQLQYEPMDRQASHQVSQELTGLEKWAYNTLLQQQVVSEASDGATTAEDSELNNKHYLQTTAAQPKGVLQECPHADDEGIYNAFSPAAVLGIRSLPNALSPDYRQQLFVQLVQAGKDRQATIRQQQQQEHSRRCASSPGAQQQQPQQCCGFRSAAGAAYKGTFSGSIQIPHRYSPTRGQFSTFGHITSEYGLAEFRERVAKLESKLAAAQVSSDVFVVRGCPLPAPHTPAFNEYDFTSTPYQEVDHLGRAITSQQEQRRYIAHGDFVPAGRSSSPAVKMRAQSADIIQQLEKQLTKDWPQSFLKVFLDCEGLVVISFDRSVAACEGDVSSYMNHQAAQGGIMQEYRLTRDPNRWGVIEGDNSVSVFYVLRPPWHVARPDIPQALQGPIPPWDRPPHETNPPHGFNRNPFGERTDAGACLNFNTRVFERTVDIRR